MIPKQDRQGVRQAKDIEQKYDLSKDYSEIEKIAANAQATANIAAARASTAQQDAADAKSEVSTLGASVGGIDKRVTELEEAGGGEDGFSPIAKVVKSGKTATITITDKTGTTTATISDGADGKDGTDGYTPQKGIDYFDGVDGKDGADGKDGSNGADATINGVNALNIQGGTGISVTQSGSTLTISASGGGVEALTIAEIRAICK